MTVPGERSVAIRDGAVTFRVLSAGAGPPVVYFHSTHERGGWSPFLAALAERHAVHAPFHPVDPAPGRDREVRVADPGQGALSGSTG